MSDQLRRLLREALADGEEHTTADLLAAVRARGGRGVSRAAVERALDADELVSAEDRLGRRCWVTAEQPTSSAAEASGRTTDRAVTRAALDRLELRRWQAEAMAAWSATGRGVVEAVTGTGKTRLALAVLRAVLDRGGRALVLVPTLELVEQWAREARVLGVRVGRLGGGSSDDLHDHDVVLATPHSAAGVPIDTPPGVPGLLVADEAHRYGAPTWAAALPEELHFRLALTATYERSDDGVADVLMPYFGEVVYRYDYPAAAADGAIAPFSVGLVGVDLEPQERASYDALDQQVRSLHGELVGALGMSRDPARLLRDAAAVVAAAERSGDGGRQARACREYLARIRQRRDVAARAGAKLEVLDRAAGALERRRSLVFTDTVEQAEEAARRLAAAGRRAETLHGALPTDRRRSRLALLRRGDLEVLVAPRVLDEGVDVPAADVAIVLAAFRTRRQLVQRLGRVLRPKAGGAPARFILAYGRATAEDPARGGHGAFLDLVRPVAIEVRSLDPGEPGELAGFLAGSDAVRPPVR